MDTTLRNETQSRQAALTSGNQAVITAAPANASSALATRLGRALVPGVLVFSDVFMASTVAALAIFLRQHLFPNAFGLDAFSPAVEYVTLWPALLVLVLLRAFFGLYPGYGLHPAEELKRQTITTFTLVGFLLAGGALFQFSADYSRVVLVTAGLLMLVVLPLVRALVKGLLAHGKYYGSLVWIVGRSDRANELAEVMTANPTLGFKVAGQSAKPPAVVRDLRHCLLVPEGLDDQPLADLLDSLSMQFRHVLLAPDLLNVSSVWVTPHDLQGNLALELRNNLREPRNKLLKRSMDIALAGTLGLLTLPVMLVVAAAVKLDSAGSALLRQARIGRNGRAFTTYKFRSMVSNAAEALEEHLASSPEAREEWNLTRKLRNDPRITRVGRFIRRTSLDELPQLWNVLKGDMSFVGPRPVMPDEIVNYGSDKDLYYAVRPGLTGMMQVSGRSELTYDERVRLDAYYVRNWSVWLDIVILAKTVRAVTDGRGAF